MNTYVVFSLLSLLRRRSLPTAVPARGTVGESRILVTRSTFYSHVGIAFLHEGS